MSLETKIEYVNTDFEIESGDDLSVLVEELEPKLSVLHHGMIGSVHHASFEVDAANVDPDEAVCRFCSLIEALSQNARAVWDAAHKRIADVGFRSGVQGDPFHVQLEDHTIERLSSLGISVAVTIYPLSGGR